MDFICDVIKYEDAIVDNTDPFDRKVILFDSEKPYKQRFFVADVVDSELIERTKILRNLNVPSF